MSNYNHTGFICSLLKIIPETTSLILRPNGFWPTIDSYRAILSLSHLPHSCPDFFLTCSLGSSGQCSFPKKEGPLDRYSVAHTEVHILGCPSRKMGSFILFYDQRRLHFLPDLKLTNPLAFPELQCFYSEPSVLISVMWHSLELNMCQWCTPLAHQMRNVLIYPQPFYAAFVGENKICLCNHFGNLFDPSQMLTHVQPNKKAQSNISNNLSKNRQQANS